MKTVAIILGIFTVAAMTGYEYRAPLREYVYEIQQPPVPPETTEEILADETTAAIKQNPTAITETATAVTAIKSELNIAVPFTSQAPFARWDAIHEETCEEASELMVDAYFNKKTFTPESADAALLALNDWEAENLGVYKDTNAEQTARTLKEYFHFTDVTTKTMTSQEDFLQTIKTELNAGKLIIIPAAGQLLGNPNFSPPGPTYHMLVVKGYTKDNDIVTNDPGTRRGHNYVYSLTTLYNALHDWNNGDIVNGKKTLIIIGT